MIKNSLRFLLLAVLCIPASAQLVYQINDGTIPPRVLVSGSVLTFPQTVLGDQSGFVIQITNSGASNAVLNTITISGTGFRLSAPELPLLLAPKDKTNLVVTFSPTAPGAASGVVVINNLDSIVLSAVGLATPLVYSYTAAGTTFTLGPVNTSVIFSPVAIGQSSQILFNVRNAGSAPIVVSNIGIGQNGSPYSVTGLPPLPVTIGPGLDIQFAIKFQPTTLGFSNGTLQLDSTSIPLIASGTAPPALPSYTLGGVSNPVPPRTQPKVSLALGATYPVAISGTLSLTTAGDLPNDPSVQFSSGGQTVSFVIPANSTNAIFANSGTSIAFQSGTVARTITLTPSFATQAGGVDLTPATPRTLQVSVVPAVPVLTSLQLTNVSANGLSIVVTGYVTTRTLTNWVVQFSTAQGFTMPQSKFTLNIQPVSALWFQGNTSLAFGGQFTITVPFSFQGALPTGATILNVLNSIAVNVSNELGSSNTVQVASQ